MEERLSLSGGGRPHPIDRPAELVYVEGLREGGIVAGTEFCYLLPGSVDREV